MAFRNNGGGTLAAVPSMVDVLRNQLVSAGTIGRFPPPALNPDPNALDGIVNLPVMFYLKPPTVTANGQTATINGSTTTSWSTALGQYTVTLTLQSIDWDFGDGDHAAYLNLIPTVDFSAAFGQPIYPPNGVSTVIHAYQRVGAFGVIANEGWRVVVTDPAGNPAMALGFQVVAQAPPNHRSTSTMVSFPGGTQLPVWPEYVHVQQAEMVPIG